MGSVVRKKHRGFRGPEVVIGIDPNNSDVLFDPLLMDEEILKDDDSLADVIGDDRVRRRTPRVSDEGME